MRGIEHRSVQTCSRCGQLFCWAPGPGWCPYCDLTQAQRSKSLTDGSGKPEPCGSDCCPERKAA
jgi:hypothetical protein